VNVEGNIVDSPDVGGEELCKITDFEECHPSMLAAASTELRVPAIEKSHLPGRYQGNGRKSRE
jgi:hypothetical protein